MAGPQRLRVLALLAAVVEDLRQFAGLPACAAGRLLGWLLFLAPSLAVTRRLAAYEAGILRDGLPAASGVLLREYYRGTAGDNRPVPARGPLLVLANHPGLGDAMALFSWLGRKDIVVLTRDRPFFRLMPALCRHTILVPEGPSMGAVRRMADALAGGCCLVVFPAGRIEPDLAWEPRAPRPLAEWPDLAGTLVRTAARRDLELPVLPVLISGVVARGATASLLVRLAGDGEARTRAAALYTFLLRASRFQRVRVRAGRLLSAGRLAKGSRGDITPSVRAELLAAAAGGVP
jgi:hypothetical protein